MANYAQTLKPSRLNLDKSRKYLNPNECFYALNHEVNNPNHAEVATGLNANFQACDMQFPIGENYSNGEYYSALTNETYSWVYNSNGVNYVQRINGFGQCEIVFSGNGTCLPLSADPKNSIKQWRAILDVDELCNKVPGGKLKRLIWVDGTDTPIGAIDVESSIATNSFTTPFFDICTEPCVYTQLCVPEPKGCLVGNFIPFVDSDSALTNNMLDRGFKFAYRNVYYDGRASELSEYSSLYYQNAKGCFDNSEGFSRCIKFRIPIGNPLVEKIEFYFSEDGGITWFLYETIEKYKQYNSANQYWYQREYTEEISSTFSVSDCSFDYTFCNDKQRLPIDPKLLTRVINPIPREVQSIFRIKDTIAAANYVLGNCPIDKTEADKFEITSNCEDDVSCDIETVDIVVRAIIYNVVSPTATSGGYVFREGGADGQADDLTDKAWFGEIVGYDQFFDGKTRDFIAYIDGTDYWVEMKQWRSTPNFNNRTQIGILSGHGISATSSRINQDIRNGNFYYQEGIMKVPKGTKGIVRLTSHHAQNGIGLNQNTSTQVIGMLAPNGLKTYSGTTTFVNPNQVIKEIYVDTCNGSFEDFGAFIISNYAYNTYAGSYSGYITDKFSLPVEGAIITADSAFKTYTDHNGFYKFIDNGNTLLSIGIKVEQDCASAFQLIESFSALADDKQVANVDYEIQDEPYSVNFFAEVDVVVKDCNNLPVRGIRVAMSGNKYKITDLDGVAHFKLRNYSTRNRMALGTVMDRGGCFTLDCENNCNPCMPSTANTLLSPCFDGTPNYTLIETTKINTQNLNANKKGLKHGGRYAFGTVIKGNCGKISAVNPIKANDGYLNIPRIQETGNLSYCSYDFNGNDATYPSWATELIIVRSANLNPYTLQWVVDDINRSTSGKITLTIQSLNDYNTQYNFKTNTIYQFLKGDRVEFIKNGDGKIFDTTTYGVLNYQVLSPFNDTLLSGNTTDANFFNQIIITDDGKLDGLTEGAVIEIQPPSVSSQQLTYFSICNSIPIVDGHLQIQNGTFETFDTFLVNRQIAKFPAQFFESKSPSDFWGETVVDDISNFLSDIGKAHFVNQYENEKRYERNISINSATQLNYFGDFIKTLDAAEQGYITAINVQDDNIGLAICQNDNFIFQISDSFLRISTTGVVMAAPVDSIISNPETKVRGQYGCLYEDAGSILFGDGFAFYVDSKNTSAIIHNYSVAQKCGVSLNQQNGQVETSCQSYFQKRLKDKETANLAYSNLLDYYRWSVGQNKTNSVIYLTLKSLRQSGINNQKEVYTLPNDTIMYSPLSDSFLGFASFTAEGYSELNLFTEDGCAFLSYQNSLPFIHPINTDTYNSFFGVPCDHVVGVSLNQFKEKLKIPLALEIQSESMFFASKVTTTKTNFLSEIPAIRWKKNVDKWNAAFLNDINSRGSLYSGNNARDYVIDVVLVKDNTINNQYGSIDDSKRIKFNAIDEIKAKFMLIESSGMTENL